ncbi:hypothetical protein MAL08_16870 [Leptospira noguchii]|uniref:hypothetical protein n=1 Tax=Leptospira noguchii TaxID=28182 RepID=UPI001FB7C299|nr:hypothetical protein [Leptospira noguchii]UOG39602.1 hypothetical protein MAL08_16870 [Leptospira noguchii]
METQHNAFLWVALETQHNAFLWVALWGGNSVLQRICRNSHRFNIEIQILVGLVMTHYGSQHNNRFRICYAELTLFTTLLLFPS